MPNPGDLTKDYLEDLPPSDVAAFYLRLATFVEQKNNKVKDALAPRLLRHYINGGGKRFIFDPPDHLKNSKYVIAVLKDQRAWYLTEKKFKGKWVGIIPRLQGKIPMYMPHRGRLVLDIRSLVEIEVKWFTSHTDGDNDLMTSLRGFQLSSMCFLRISDIQGKSTKKITFSSFDCNVTDRYDFDPDEYFPVPNPDFNNKFKVPNPVAPSLEKILVYHSNAIRMEKAGKAAPFDVASNGWTVMDLSIMGPAEIDPNKDLD